MCLTFQILIPGHLSITHHISTGFSRYVTLYSVMTLWFDRNWLWAFSVSAVGLWPCRLQWLWTWLSLPLSCHTCHNSPGCVCDTPPAHHLWHTPNILQPLCPPLSVCRDCLWGLYSEDWSATSHLCRTLSLQSKIVCGVLDSRQIRVDMGFEATTKSNMSILIFNPILQCANDGYCVFLLICLHNIYILIKIWNFSSI